MRMRLLALLAALYALNAFGQTTQGIIVGQVRDRSTGRPLAGALVQAACSDPEIQRSAYTSESGHYAFPNLPPGNFRLTVTLASYQSRESYDRLLSVAGYLQADFELRPLSDVWESGRYRSAIFRNESVLTYFGPDVDPAYAGNFEPGRASTGQLEPSVSEVIDPKLIDTLPLAGRDVYTAIVLLPGITSDTTTTRSIGISANGQRPTSSNFLLDGVDNNSHLLTGPLLTLAPEAMQEYRVSSNNFSAEYGGVTGYVANAITRAASPAWHGIAYANFENSVLNANTFDRNSKSLGKTPSGEVQPGFRLGGALPVRGLTFSSAFESFHAHSAFDTAAFFLPTEAFYSSLPAGSLGRQVLDQHRPSLWAPGEGDSGVVSIAPPVSLSRLTALERLDYTPSNRDHLLVRVAGASLTNPDFRWSPYGSATLRQNTVGGAVTYEAAWTPRFTTEARFGSHRDRLGWGLINSDVPGLVIIGGPLLPGVPSSDKAFEDRSTTTSLDGGATWSAGKHLVKAGGGWATTHMKDRFSSEPNGTFYFPDTESFRLDQPILFETMISRTGLQTGEYVPVATTGRYSRNRAQIYAQEDYRATPNLTVNVGLRYESFGAPVASADTRNAFVSITGRTLDGLLTSRTGGAILQMQGGTWAGRFGASYSPEWRGHTLTFRAGYGAFHDGLFDNLWSPLILNDFEIASFDTQRCPVTLGPGGPPSLFTARCFEGASDFLDLTAFASPMRIPSSRSGFIGAQWRAGANLTFEVNGLGSASRALFSSDVLNRYAGAGRPSSLPDVYYRSNDSHSHYAALTTSVRYQSPRAGMRIYYTWSHSIDNQSDPLLGEFFDLGFSNQSDRGGKRYYGAFTVPGNPDADTGNSDFDQRHNLAAFSYWDLPALPRGRAAAVSRGWRVSQTLVARSGLPYSVYAGDQNCHPLCNTRADLVNAAAVYGPAAYPSPPGTQRLLNPEAFSAPPSGLNGATGRNAFRGPGFWTLDLSVAREFAIWERVRLELRADAFNLANHANLQSPDAYFGTSATSRNPDFGVASFGRTEKAGFPALTPFIENARQIQLLVRLRF